MMDMLEVTVPHSRGSITNCPTQLPAGIPKSLLATGQQVATPKEPWLIIVGDAEAARSALVDILKDADQRGISTDRARRGAQQACDEGQPALPVCESDTDEDQLQAEPTQQDSSSKPQKEGSKEPPKAAAKQKSANRGQQAVASRVKLEHHDSIEEHCGKHAASTRPGSTSDRIPPDET